MGRDCLGNLAAISDDRRTAACTPLNCTDVIFGTVNVGCARRGPCRNCHAETLLVGGYQQVIAAIVDPTVPLPPLPADAATPWAHPRCRATT